MKIKTKVVQPCTRAQQPLPGFQAFVKVNSRIVLTGIACKYRLNKLIVFSYVIDYRPIDPEAVRRVAAPIAEML